MMNYLAGVSRLSLMEGQLSAQLKPDIAAETFVPHTAVQAPAERRRILVTSSRR